MIRVLQVVTYMGRGGLETMLMNNYRHIDREQVQFDFLTHRSFEADYDAEIKEMGGKIWHLPRLNPFSLSYRRKLNEFFRDHPEYQIVHCHQDCLSGIALEYAMKNHVPVRIAHSHNSSQDHNWKYPIKLYFKKDIPRYATDLLACSKTAGDWMFGDHPFTVIHNAIEVSRYRFNAETRKSYRDQLNIPQKAIVIGHVGRFAPTKNQAFLVEILQEMLKDQDNVYLLLVGDGPKREEVESKAKTMGLDDHVIFTGVRSDVADLLQAMDVFVFPSLYEGLPLSVIEAQAAGLPVIMSDHVSQECAITDLVQTISLNEPARIWCDQILQVVKTTRTDTSERIREAGYDVSSEAQKLQNFYLKKIHAVKEANE